MIRFVYRQEIDELSALRDSMHLDRAFQFKARLRWDISLRDDGQEHDEYDALNPLYIMVEDAAGLHAGSMRLLPTTGQTMVNDHFSHLTDGVKISSPLIWECTRLCVAHDAPRTTAAQLLAAGAKVMQEFCIDHFVGVFDTRMIKIYGRLGACPTIVGQSSDETDTIAVGLWEFDDTAFKGLCKKGRLDPDQLAAYFDASSLGNAGVQTPGAALGRMVINTLQSSAP